MTVETGIAALDIIASAPPRLAASAVVEIAARHYGLDVTAAPLVSERDQNFRLQAADGRQYVLKIANAGEDPQFTDFQIRALQHIAAAPPEGIAVPAIVTTEDGKDRLLVEHAGREHTLRVVTFLAGKPLDPASLSATLAEDMGAALARLGRSLAGFRHPGASQPLLWDLREAPGLRRLLPNVADTGLRRLLADTLDEFSEHALPRLAGLRSQVIHNDMNPGNVLVDGERVAAVIDFGDMQHAPLVLDVGVAGAYLRNAAGDPLEFIASFVAGYHAVTALAGEEVDLLYDLIAARLATTISLLAWRSADREAGDEYLGDALGRESGAARFLERLRQLPRADASRRLRQVCASVDVAAQPVL